ncbi:hypothetical protein NG696_19660 [Pseudarthrobacter sp. HLT1-5]|nr:hypothetical protein [Pseudarthrobacter sp. HLT1-5]
MTRVRSRQAVRGHTGKRAVKSRAARRKVKVERRHHRRYAGVSGAKPRLTRKSARPSVASRQKAQRRPAVTTKPRTYRRRITKPAPKAPPISAASYLSMF